MMHKNKSVDVHQFAMIPKADIPRSSFMVETAHKTTFDGGFLIPVYLDEVLPGDSHSLRMTAFCRMSTPLFPVMDNLHMESFFFFVPNRLLWSNWRKFMGEQVNPSDSISFVVPQQVSPVGGYAVGSLQDYMGLPTVGQVGGGNTISHCAFFTRAYNLVWNEWFRDENLQNSLTVDTGDGPDATASVTYQLRRRGKRKDYFTSALPWPQKGGISVTLPLGTRAPISGLGVATATTFPNAGATVKDASTTSAGVAYPFSNTTVGVGLTYRGTLAGATGIPDIYADLSQATAATINQLRQSFQIQKLLERDARSGTRYTELIRAHFGVVSPDARLQRPEYLGGGTANITVNPIAQQSATGLTGGSSPLGSLGGVATGVAQGHGFTQSFTEHGVIIGLVNVRADLTYQQGMRKMWSRSTRYDFYMPVFANLGEQSVLNREIFADGSANDALAFGFQERWGEYRWHPSMITGLFRSTSAGTIDPWHLAQRFVGLPTLNDTFIQDTPPMSRVIAVGAGANGQQFIFDSIFQARKARAMPLYSVPGLIDHF